MNPKPGFLVLGAVVIAFGAGGARAQSAAFGPEAFHGLAEVRLASTGGENSWLDHGSGKTDALEGLSLSEVALEWRPRFNFALAAVITAELQPKVSDKVDLGEAYLQLKSPPSELGRLSGRAGLFYPPVSLENDGVAWTHPDMISASALNSWIGEEVKVVGVEATLTREFGAHEVSLTGATFGWNDTSGTLLSFRGWAQGSVKSPTRDDFELPPLSPFMSARQGDETYPIRELDHRVGYYGRVEWRPPAPVSFEALYYDNVGDRTSVDSHRQWAWETRFLNLGLKADLGPRTRILAQVVNGETLMGYRYLGERWLDVGFQAAYLEVRRAIGEDALTGRIDGFTTNDRTLKSLDNNDETGWAAAGAWRHRLAPHADLILEALHVSSDRPGRAYGGMPARQDQTVLQSALRLWF
ncbi:MAG TPA: hypothetical protein VFW47_16880 [Phenylobacterium sp.]|nr:hypothetical protein [Phenylobacterium sp.]